jgi:hypothetical protein
MLEKVQKKKIEVQMFECIMAKHWRRNGLLRDMPPKRSGQLRCWKR